MKVLFMGIPHIIVSTLRSACVWMANESTIPLTFGTMPLTAFQMLHFQA